ncbi:MAG: type ISP restriction/modification enzyme [Bdellovibrionota bacterium]
MTFQDVLEKIRKISTTEREKGKNFEKIIKNYLLTDPKYANNIKKIWLWNEFPSKSDLSQSNVDIGIDLIYLTNDNKYVAVQCKCYSEETRIDKASIDSFLATSSKKFKDVETKEEREFSMRMLVATINDFSSIAEETLNKQTPEVVRILESDLSKANVDWKKLYENYSGNKARGKTYEAKKHQVEAINKTHKYFKKNQRGKLIMACGTGKTFTALRIAEKETSKNGICLYLVPSIALLGQTLREWHNQSKRKITSICVCSDAEVVKASKKNKNDDEDRSFSIKDLAEPASTHQEVILERINNARKNIINKKDNINKKNNISKKDNNDMIVIFSTYQSIDVIINVQKKLLSKNKDNIFDIIICDEAHRTTGFARKDEDVKIFSKVHDNKLLKTNKRLYMTATPRIYGEAAKQKVKENSAVLFSMDDSSIYGDEIYRIGFGEAVEQNLLSDYKVYILTVFNSDLSKSFINECKESLRNNNNNNKSSIYNDSLVKQGLIEKIKDDDQEIEASDIVKIVGCINALSQTVAWGEDINQNEKPMKSAVAFCNTIANSKRIANAFNQISPIYKDYAKKALPKIHPVVVEADHVDGGMSAPLRYEKLSKLKENGPNTQLLSNVRCLSEGVDVPSLDAVLFLTGKNSQVDVVQSVGRVMRKSEGKRYGYIIIPVVTKSKADAKKVLDKSDNYKVVWEVLNALRAHDERFDALVNKIRFNKSGGNISIGGNPTRDGIGGKDKYDEDGNATQDGNVEERGIGEGNFPLLDGGYGGQMSFDFEEFKGCIYAKLVEKVGTKDYWDVWAKDVAEIALEQEKIIKKQVNKKGEYKAAFNAFLQDLKRDINPSIDEKQAIEMLSQHLITEPVFEALFGNNIFSKLNPISLAMEKLIAMLDSEDIRKGLKSLEKFYDSVKRRVQGIETAQGKQAVIKELYETFFKTAFSKMVDKLGIVYTPIEVVDFIIHSVEAILNREFNRSLNDKEAHILDPFTGTGTFISRLLQSNIITRQNLKRKYENEIHANEIVLLAYYIASVNIENVYHDILVDIRKSKNKNDDNKNNNNKLDYVPFNGICLTDTFQIGEDDKKSSFAPKITKENSKRVQRQSELTIKIIIGNPPYSRGQKSANDDAQNEKYEKLDKRITDTYVKESSANLKNSIYDSYFKAFRWSTDRIGDNKGIVAFITNSGWLDGNSGEGFRKVIEKEFSKIYVLNLRGAVRGRVGDSAKKEGQNIFDIMTGVAIAILVKDPKCKRDKAKIYYHDIGDYLSRKEKLEKLSDFKDISKVAWDLINPNKHGDWISKRNENFKTFIPINTNKKFNKNSISFFETYSLGISTNRDPWSYNSSLKCVQDAAKSSINFYNDQRRKLHSGQLKEVNKNTNKISWTEPVERDAKSGVRYAFEDCEYRESLYRPFFKQNLLWYKPLIERTFQMPKLFPTANHKNIVICTSSVGDNHFSLFISNIIPDLHLTSTSQCFPLYWYEPIEDVLDDDELSFAPMAKSKKNIVGGYVKHDGVTDYILNEARRKYKSSSISKEDIFYYVYGILHSKEYRKTFKADLKRELPRLPLVKLKDFEAFLSAGRALAKLHLDYENVPAYPLCRVVQSGLKNYKVIKLKYEDKSKKDVLIYNEDIRIENIPAKAHKYIINGRSALDWLIDRYQVTTDKKSGITNDPNAWGLEHSNPRYILNLILSVINLSVQSVEIIEKLPKIKF